MTRLALLLLACSFEPADYSIHAPPTDGCGRVPIEYYTAGPDECIRLQDTNGRTIFKWSDSTSCGGPHCIIVEPGETGLVLEKVKLGEAAQWSVERGPCSEVPAC